ncbi:protein associated with UVRAG as autophagy enhancer isoform 2-T2 [Anomaloglossus baeobatrachus]|uniref:protein associated with UVRAG as autophagy enhancer isoform X2 n=1 Tax=Anomaloglossus baeobatrachus TaxID=238106 RepID=UPI003F4F51DF
MSMHTMTLTTYSTTRAKKCARTAQVRSFNKRYLERPPILCPLFPLLSMPRTPTVLFTEDVLPRPAVIGVGSSYGSYADSANAIKEILCSVLNLPRSVSSTTSMNADPEDSDVEDLKDTSTRGHNMASNCDPDGSLLLTTAQNDIRFNRHKAAWDNTQLDSSTMSPLDPHTPITSTYVVPELDLSPYIQCEKCTDFILPESEFFPPQNLPINSRKERRRFSSPSVAPHHVNPTSCTSILDEFALHLNETETNSETSTVEEKSVHRRSMSCSNIFKVSGTPPASSTEALQLFGENVFEPTVNLEKENEHFLAADLFISVVEMMKTSWQSDQFRTEGGMYWLRKDPDEPCYRRHKANSESATSVDSGYDGLVAVQSSPVETILEEEEFNDSTTCDEDYDSDYVIIEMEDYEKLTTNNNVLDTTAGTGPTVSNTAEQTARNLYRAFRQQWTLIDVDGPLPAKLTTNTRSYANMIPEEFESSVCLVEEIKRFRMLDDEDWSPPRFQVLTTVHQYIRRDVVVASQNYLCAGCGTKVEQRYTSRLRYCDYLGKYFCDCCHHYSESSIPGRILSKWNFSKYYVSNFSKNVVDKIWDSHTFNVQSENPALYKKVKDLNRVQEVQQQLIHIRRLVTTCRFADGIIKAFEDVPSHLTEELHLFTLADLFNVKQKTLLPNLRELLALAIAHVEECELCKAKGFFCEFCRHSDVIFPFQTDICRRCEDCKMCYHKECFKTNDCPKCIRIKAREALNQDLSFTSSEEVDSTSLA